MKIKTTRVKVLGRRGSHLSVACEQTPFIPVLFPIGCQDSSCLPRDSAPSSPCLMLGPKPQEPPGTPLPARPATPIPMLKRKVDPASADHRWTGGPSHRDGSHLPRAACLLRSNCPRCWNSLDTAGWGSLSNGLVPTKDNINLGLPLKTLFWVGLFTA